MIMSYVATIVFIGILVCGCSDLLKPETPVASGPNAGIRTYVRMTHSFSRSAVPGFDKLSWKISAAQGEETITASGSYPDYVLELSSAGSWEITVEGYNGAGEVILSGKKIAQIDKNNTTVTVALMAASGLSAGKGETALALSVPETVEKIVYTFGKAPYKELFLDDEKQAILKETACGGIYILTLYFLDANDTTLYIATESVNIWNGVITDRWENSGGSTYITTEGEFKLTTEDITTFRKSVGSVVYVDGAKGSYGSGTIFAPLQTFEQGVNTIKLNCSDGTAVKGTIIITGELSVAEECTVKSGEDLVIEGLGAGAKLENKTGRVFTVETGGRLTVGKISLSGDAGNENGGAVLVKGNGEFVLEEGAEISGSSAASGGGVYVEQGGKCVVNGTVKVSGNTLPDGQTAGNVYLESDTVLTIGDDGLGDGSVIGVTTQMEPLGNGAAVTIAEFVDSVFVDAAAKFSDDRELYVIAENGLSIEMRRVSGTGIIKPVPVSDYTIKILQNNTELTKDGNYFVLGIGNPEIRCTLYDTEGKEITDSVQWKVSVDGSIKSKTDVYQFLDDEYPTDRYTVTVYALADDTLYSQSFTTVKISAGSGIVDETILINSPITVSPGVGEKIEIDAIADMPVFEIIDGGELTLGGEGGGEVVIDGGELDTTNGSNSLIKVTDGTLNIQNGVVIQNNKLAANSGGGIFIGPSGVVNMTGGTITGCQGYESAGGVYVNGGHFYMSDGEITDCRQNRGGDGGAGGGAVSIVNNGLFVLEGTAKIYSNVARMGGGVYVNGGTFRMDGGIIGGTTADLGNNAWGTQNGFGGGGVYGNNSTIILNEGRISYNTCTGGNLTPGGGMVVHSGILRYINVDFLDNTASSGNGNDVYINAGVQYANSLNGDTGVLAADIVEKEGLQTPSFEQ